MLHVELEVTKLLDYVRDVKVTPVSGNGETWVSASRVTVMGAK